MIIVLGIVGFNCYQSFNTTSKKDNKKVVKKEKKKKEPKEYHASVFMAGDALIHSAVYTDGITATFLNHNKLYAVCLLDASNNIIATSAAIKYLAIPNDGYITSVLSWASESKQLIVSALDFTKTKSIVFEDGKDGLTTQIFISL